MFRSMHHLLLNATCEECGLYGSSHCADCDVERSRQKLVLIGMNQRSFDGAYVNEVPSTLLWDTSRELSLVALTKEIRKTA